MNDPAFFEIILLSPDFTFGGRDEIEDPLEDALRAAGLGEITGGGTGMGKSNIDIEVTDAERGLVIIRDVLKRLGVAPSTIIRQSGSPAVCHFVYG
jgi:hypothetical protein